jgi:diguanylate cyclase (GGDEF)-like protein
MAALGNAARADAAAILAIDRAPPDATTESQAQAWRVRYDLAKARGDLAAALAHYQRYTEASRAYADDAGQRALAFQMARYEARAKNLQIESLNQQNQVLTLQQQVAVKNAEAARLTVALLSTLLAFGLFWAIRTWRLRRHFQQLAQRDSLTQVANRRYFIEQVTERLAQLQRARQSAALILVDLDYFKLINDRYGHAEGDEVLQRAAAALAKEIASGELLGRIGGEEFAVLLPRVERSEAIARAERFRLALHSVDYGTGPERRRLSASFGVCDSAIAGYALRDLMSKADAALYVAKDTGRDRVVTFEAEAVAVA